MQDRIVEAQCLNCGSIDKFVDALEPCHFTPGPTFKASPEPDQASARLQGNLWDEITSLRKHLNHVEREIYQHIDKGKKPTLKAKYKGIET